MKKVIEDFSQNRNYYIIIIISVFLGAFVRFKGLGKWPLALDEYYIVKSAENILKYGLPEFSEGGYYDRGILLQYFISLLLSLSIKAELAGRILPVFANLITIPAVYLIAKRLGNQLIATIAVFVFCFSIWEIELARFARMYTPFQAIFIWYIYFVIKIGQNNLRDFKWLILLSGLSVFVYEGSIFLAVFNFIPLIIHRLYKIKYILPSILMFFTSFTLNFINFRFLNVESPFPAEYESLVVDNALKLPIKIPKILAVFAVDSPLHIIITLTIILISFTLLWKIIREIKDNKIFSVLALLLFGTLTVLNQFLFALLLLILFNFWNLLSPSLFSKRNTIFLLIIFLMNLMFWFGFGIFTKDWFILFNDFSSYNFWGIAKKIVVAFVNYPDNYYTVLNYFRTLPILSLFSAVSIIYIISLSFIKRNINQKILYLTGILIFFALLATSLNLPYQETRYTFFLVPILMILTIYANYHFIFSLRVNQQTKTLLTIFLILIIFIFSKDFNFYHLVNIDKAEINYRMNYDNKYKVHLYRRWDVKTPTEYVKKHLQENDLIMINENSHEYYLPKVDYFNFDISHRMFVNFSVDGGNKERWSDARLIYNNNDLMNFIDNRKSTIWFTVYPENWLLNIDFYNKYKDYFVFEGIDKMIKVYKFPKKD